jgi:hypothetical protein
MLSKRMLIELRRVAIALVKACEMALLEGYGWKPHEPTDRSTAICTPD